MEMKTYNAMGSLGVEPFQTTFAVSLHCDTCVDSISSALQPLPGIHAVNADLGSQLVHVTGTTPPSQIVSAIQCTGRDAILRGSGRPNTAAVCILEASMTAGGQSNGTVTGLARIVQVRDDDRPRTLVDLALKGMRPGSYDATVRETGDISRGVASVGPMWGSVKSAFSLTPNDARKLRGHLGQVEVGKDGRANAFLNRDMAVAEVIGRAMVVRQRGVDSSEDQAVLGVIARSAGAWENEKAVCSCSGKTVWEERKEQLGRGVL